MNIFRPFRGVGAVVAGAGPAHAFYFATYEHSKEVMSNIYPQYDHINYGMFIVYLLRFQFKNKKMHLQQLPVRFSSKKTVFFFSCLFKLVYHAAKGLHFCF